MRIEIKICPVIYCVLFQKNYNKVLLICLEKDDDKHILTELHDGSVGSHFSRETTTHKFLREG